MFGRIDPDNALMQRQLGAHPIWLAVLVAPTSRLVYLIRPFAREFLDSGLAHRMNRVGVRHHQMTGLFLVEQAHGIDRLLRRLGLPAPPVIVETNGPPVD